MTNKKPPLPERKNIRWEKQDYSHPGEYMITICTKDMKQILSKITVGNPQTVGDGALDVPYVELTPYGKIVEKHILNSNRIDGTTVLKYVIMPNHVHILVRIENENKKENTPANDTIPRFVGVLKRFVHREIGEKIFQRSFHDHVIRDENDLIGAVKYIDNNPVKWIEE